MGLYYQYNVESVKLVFRRDLDYAEQGDLIKYSICSLYGKTSKTTVQTRNGRASANYQSC